MEFDDSAKIFRIFNENDISLAGYADKSYKIELSVSNMSGQINVKSSTTISMRLFNPCNLEDYVTIFMPPLPSKVYELHENAVIS